MNFVSQEGNSWARTAWWIFHIPTQAIGHCWTPAFFGFKAVCLRDLILYFQNRFLHKWMLPLAFLQEKSGFNKYPGMKDADMKGWHESWVLVNGNMRRLRRCDSAKRSHAASFHGIAGASYVHMVPSALKGSYETFVDVAIQFSAFFCCANSSKHRGKACPPH